MEAIIVAEKHPLETQAQVAGALLLNLDQRTFSRTDESIAKNLDRIAGQSGSVALLFKARHEQRAVFVGDRAARGVGIADMVVRDAGFKHQRSGDSQGERGYDLTIQRQASVHDLIALDLQLSLDLRDLNSGAGRVAKSAGGDAVFGDLASANDAPALDPGGSHGIDAVLRDNGRAFARHRHADVAVRQRVAGHAVRPAGRAKDCDAARGNTIVLHLAALDRS